MSETPPRLPIVCSTPEGRQRLERVAADLLSRMPPELAARLARTVMVFALDTSKHSAFAQGLGTSEDATRQLAEERTRQQADPREHLSIIVLNLDESRRLPSDAQMLAHELAHHDLGHTNATLLAANGDDREQIERAADRWAAQFLPEW